MTKNHYLVLFLILICAALTRFIGLNWDSGSHLHPDERFLTMVASTITLPANIPEYFDTQASPANPHNRNFSFYVYGTYPMFLTKLAARILRKDTYDGIVLVGRGISALTDLLTVFIVFCIGMYLTKRPAAGLLSALCYTLAVLPIQLSHFFTVDPFVTLFITIALWRIIRGRFDIVTGIAIGLAVSAKISAVLILPVAACGLITAWPFRGRTPLSTEKRTRLLIGGVLTAIGVIVTIRVAYPYLFSGFRINPLILNNWKQLASFDGPTTSFPPGLQWIHVSPWQPMLDMMFFGLGLPLTILAFISIIRHIWSMWKKPRWNPAITLLLWPVLLFGYQSFQFGKAMRYFWAAYPVLSVFAGMEIYQLIRIISSGIRQFPVRMWIYAGMVITLLIWPLSFMSVYTHTNTRVAASTWIYTHIPAKSTIAWEHWDDPLPFAVGTFTPSAYTQIQLPSFDPDDTEKIRKIQDTLERADYLILSSNRAYGALNRVKTRFPLTNRFYQKLFSGRLGYSLIAQFTSRPVLSLPVGSMCIHIPGFSYGAASRTLEQCAYGIQIIDDYAEETFTVYDHPKVLIFQNIQHLPELEILSRLHE